MVDLASERLGINVEYDAAKIKGTVTLRLGGGITDEELWQLTNRLLASRGFTTVRRAGEDTISVVPLAEAIDAARIEPEGVSSDGRTPAGFRTQVVRVTHASTQSVVDSLQPLVGKSGRITRVGQSDRLLVSATADQMDLVHRFLLELDAPGAATTIAEVRIEHLEAERLMALVEQVQASRELVSGRRVPGKLLRAPDGDSVLIVAPDGDLAAWRALITSLDQREPVLTRSYSPAHFGLDEVRSLIESTVAPGADRADERWRIVTDSLTGSLLITATEIQHEQVEALMQRLADAPAETRRPMRSWTMRNRPVDEVVSVLEGLLAAGAIEASVESEATSSADFAERGTMDADVGQLRRVPPPPESRNFPLAPSTPAQPRSVSTRSDLTLTSDTGTNTLIAVGSPRLLDQVDVLLATIDIRQPQVMIEVLMLGLTDAETKDLAVHLDHIVTKGGTLVRLASLFGISDFAGRTSTSGLAGAGGTAVILDPGDFGVLVRALETLNQGRTLSMPRVLATNNIAATFNSTVNEPYLSTNASDTVATTSFGGSESAGTQITITPQIAAGDHLLLEYNVTLSAFVGESADPALPPARQQNVISSTASIPDGYTVAVGGFEFTAEGDSVNQVPLIAKVPLLGELFKSRSHSGSRTRFYVFIRANVMRSTNFDDLKYISDQWAGDADLDTGWPTVQPQVIR